MSKVAFLGMGNCNEICCFVDELVGVGEKLFKRSALELLKGVKKLKKSQVNYKWTQKFS